MKSNKVKIEFSGWSYHDYCEAMKNHINHVADTSMICSHRGQVPHEHDIDLEIGLYLVPATGSYFAEVTEDNPRIAWHIRIPDWLLKNGIVEMDLNEYIIEELPKVRRNTSTPEGRAIWDEVEKVAAKAPKWAILRDIK